MKGPGLLHIQLGIGNPTCIQRMLVSYKKVASGLLKVLMNSQLPWYPVYPLLHLQFSTIHFGSSHNEGFPPLGQCIQWSFQDKVWTKMEQKLGLKEDTLFCDICKALSIFAQVFIPVWRTECQDVQWALVTSAWTLHTHGSSDAYIWMCLKASI